MLRLALLACLSLSAAPTRAADLELRFLDVGQGDAVLLTHESKAVLIDTGPTDGVVAQLRQHGVTELDLLVLSHNHSDHIGGADAVLGQMPVRRFLDNGFPASTKIEERVLRLVHTANIPVLEPTDRTIRLGDLSLRLLPPPAAVEGDEQNNHSVGLVIEHGSFHALLTGDSEVEEQQVWLNGGRIPTVDVLKAAHHGSRNGVSPAWLLATKPTVVVISCGAGNTYGHPHVAALRYYAAAGRRVLRTDIDGEVLVRVATAGTYVIETTHAVAAASPPTAPGPAVSPPPVASPPPAHTATLAATAPACCRTCSKGKACGDGCVSASATCNKPPGCACDGER